MPRAFMDRTGFKLAAAGKDARTATGLDILMSSDYSNFGLYVSGLVTLTLIQQQPSGVASPLYVYRQGIINFGKTFAIPPMAFVGAIKPNGYVCCAQLGEYSSSSGGDVLMPDIYWTTSTTQLLIYCKADYDAPDNLNWHGPDATQAAYYILENTLQ